MAIRQGNGFAHRMISSGVYSDLGIVTKSNVMGFYKAFDNLAKSSIVAQLEASGAVEYTKSEFYEMYFQNSKDRNKFRVDGDVEVTASGQVTVNIIDYTDADGNLSAPEEGLFFRENSTGVEFEVISVNKGTGGAHTAVIKPTVTGVTITIPEADAEFFSVGRPSVQEASFQQAGEYKGWDQRTNWTRIIRTNKAYTDLATMLAVEHDPEGRSFYDLDKTDLPKQHIDVKEMELMLGIKRDNVTSTGNRNSKGYGFVPLVKDYGTSIDGAGTVLDKALFRQIARSISGNGFVKEYLGIADTEAMFKVQDFLQTNDISHQHANATGSELRALFDYNTNFTFDGISYGFKSYDYWNAQRLAGADVSKSFLSNQILLMPQGVSYDSEGSGRPFMRLRYHNNNIAEDEGLFNKVDYGGALFGHGTTRHGEVSITSYMGAEINGVEQFIYVKLSN